MKNIVLRMPRTESDSNDGINDGNIETYKNKPMLSLTKEELQNSTDGAIKNPDGSPMQVIVEFHDFYLETSKIPDIEKLKEVYKDEWAYWESFLQNDRKALYFLEQARVLLKQDKIRCLRISDFNTTGLKGINGQSTPWKNLVKNRGVSDKPQTATGSFGIGKDAAFACSQIRTVFYNTINNDDSDNCAFQGVLKLPTYKKGDDNYVGMGFFSAASDNPRQMDPVMESLSLDPDYCREGTGMDKYILGFDDSTSKDELKKQIIVSSITNFLYAFWEDKLVVKYDDIIVDKAHLDELFELYKDDLDRLTRDYYATLKEPDKCFYVSVINDDDVKIYVKLMKDAGRRAAITRQSGMKVFNKDRINGRIEFAAVVVLCGDEANGYFKTLENPEHTSWSLDRAKVKSEAKRNQNIIFEALQNAIKEMHQADYASEMDADGMNEYLPMTYITGKKKKIEGLSNEIETKTKAKKKPKKVKPNIVEQEQITYEEDEQGNIIESTIEIVPPNSEGQNHGGGNHDGESDNKVTGGDGDETLLVERTDGSFVSKRVISNENFRFVLSETEGIYKLKFCGNKKVNKGFAEIMISGETEAIPMGIKTASVDGVHAIVNGNRIKFDCLEADTKHEIVFEFIHSGDWAIEVVIHES